MKPNYTALRYHYKIWFPETVNQMLLDFFNNFDKIGLTTHASDKLVDRHTKMLIPVPTRDTFMVSSNKLIEFYELTENGKPIGIMQKALIRITHLDEKYDYCYVIARDGYIVSAWISEKTDYPRLTYKFADYYCPINHQAAALATVKKMQQDFEGRTGAQ